MATIRKPSPLAALSRARIRVLTGNRGSIVESIGDAILTLVTIALVAGGTIVGVQALNSGTGNAERLQAIDALISKPQTLGTVSTTGTAKTLTLPSGRSATATVWRTAEGTGSHYYASVPNPTTKNPSLCTNTTTVYPRDCLYASMYWAADPRSVLPAPLPGVTSKVGVALNAGDVLASAPAPATETLWRYYIDPGAVAAGGTVQIMQGSNLLAVVPLLPSKPSFGTVIAKPGAAITFLSPDRALTVSKFLLYPTGATP